MAIITPQTDIYLLKCPLQLSNKNQMTFADSEAQFNYFQSLDKILLNDGSYQRKDGVIRYPAHIDTIQEYNYCMYKNDNYTNKWFYAFIVNMEYVNDNMTFITIKTDVFQTWQFALNWRQSFIEREMLNTNEDVVGANLLPENFETGEYKIGGTASFDDLEPVNVIAYSGEKVPDLPYGGLSDISINQGAFKVNGIDSSVCFILATDNFGVLMAGLQKEAFSSYIVATFTVPKLAVKDFLISANKYPSTTTFPGLYILQNPGTYTQAPTTKTLLSTPDNLDGYVPRNQKLRTYPYMYLGFNPSNGNKKVYRYEDFTNGTPQFKIISEVNPNPTIAFIPQNYRGSTGDSLQDFTAMNGYPTIANKTDTFNVWLARNSELINIQREHEENQYNMNQLSNIAGTLGNAGINMALGNPVGSISSLGNGIVNAISNQENHDYFIKNQMAQIEKQKMLPDTVNMGSSNATLLGYGLIDDNIFSRYTIKAQFAERIDKYFDMYGYLTNKVKIPNITGRPNWNYVKTIGANILANIPQLDLAEIKSMFDNGVTLWHNTNTFLDYSQNNR